MARLLADENVPLPVVEALRSHGHDVVVSTASPLGSGASDVGVLTLARAEQRVVVTLDRRDFFRLHRQHPDHEGIIACTFDPDFAGQAKRIHEGLHPNAISRAWCCGSTVRPADVPRRCTMLRLS